MTGQAPATLHEIAAAFPPGERRSAAVEISLADPAATIRQIKDRERRARQAAAAEQVLADLASERERNRVAIIVHSHMGQLLIRQAADLDQATADLDQATADLAAASLILEAQRTAATN